MEIIGYTGIALVLAAYVPQVHHLISEKCSAGISRKAFLIWLVSGILLFANAIATSNFVFITLQFINMLCTAIILFYAQKYKDSVCTYHKVRCKLSSKDLDNSLYP